MFESHECEIGSHYLKLDDGTPIVQVGGKAVAIDVGYHVWHISDPFWHWCVNYPRSIRFSWGEIHIVQAVIYTLCEDWITHG